jgi:hypothetical protein
VNDELEKCDKVYLKALSWHLPGGTEEDHKNLSQGNLSLGKDLNPGTPNYGVLTTQPQYSLVESCCCCFFMLMG